MSRNLIDRDALIASIPKTNVDIFENCRNCNTLMDWQVKELIDKQPTIDAVEVVHGEWKIYERPNGGYYTGCSVCSFPLPTDSQLDFMDETDSKYCPNCGAKMDGEVKNDG